MILKQSKLVYCLTKLQLRLQVTINPIITIIGGLSIGCQTEIKILTGHSISHYEPME